MNIHSEKILPSIEFDKNDVDCIVEVPSKDMTDSKRINRGPFKLKLGAMTLFPFFKHVFSFQLFLLDDLQRLVCGHEVPVSVRLFYENDSSQLNDSSLFSLERGPIIIDKTGMATVHMKFNTLSMNHANKRFVLQFYSAYDRTKQRIKTTNELDVEFLSNISSISTLGLQVVRNRLLVQTTIQGVEGEEKHDVWYKDEGGRENCIDMTVSLQDCDGRLVSNRSVPLVVILIYDNGDVVSKQEFLHIQSDSVLCIQGTGKTSIKLRINDVSKNHQRQLFKILVSPDTASSPLLLDISSDQSTSIEVKSKRTSKRKASPDAAAAYARGGMLVQGRGAATPSSSSSGMLYSAADVKQEYRDALESAKQSGFMMSYGGQYLPTPRSASAMDTLLNNAGGNSSYHQHHTSGTKEDSNSGMSMEYGNDNVFVTDKAISAMVDWTSSVLTTLQSVKWKPIGFEQRPSDGFIDHSKPLHSITNPNAAIDQLLSEYALSDIGSTLTTLLMRVNEINGKEGSARKRSKVASSGSTLLASASAAASLTRSHNSHSSSNGTDNKAHAAAAAGFHVAVSPRVEEAAVGCIIESAGAAAAGGVVHCESSVNYILATMQKTASCTAAEECGFPAFNSNMQLVGFYQEKRDILNNSTVISFTPYNNNFTLRDKENAETLLMTHLHASSAAVYSLSRCNNDLQAMKHECLVHFWLSEVNLEEEGSDEHRH